MVPRRRTKASVPAGPAPNGGCPPRLTSHAAASPDTWGTGYGMNDAKRGTSRVMVTFIIVLIIVGLIAGAVARLLVPGRDPIGILGTILLGVVGSFVGGFLWQLIEFHRIPHKFHTSGIIGSIIGAVILLLILRLTGAERGRSRSRVRSRFCPGAPPHADPVRR